MCPQPSLGSSVRPRRWWDRKAAQVEALPIGLEKADISMQQVTLVWVPVAQPA